MSHETKILKIFLLLLVFAFCVSGIRSCNSKYNYEIKETAQNETQNHLNNKDSKKDYEITDLQNWNRYEIKNFMRISVTPKMELRQNNDIYTEKAVKPFEKIFHISQDRVVFQQKDLKDMNSEAFSHYARIIISHIDGNYGDFLKHNKTEPIDEETERILLATAQEDIDMMKEVYPNAGITKVLGTQWLSVGNSKVLKFSYLRTNTKDGLTKCTWYYLQNNNEMAIIIISYWLDESEYWLPDLDNVIKTFEWIDEK